MKLKSLLSIFSRQPRCVPAFGASDADCQRIRRPFGADTDCGKILAALEKGERITALRAFAICGGTSADRRIRDIRSYLRLQGRTLHERWVTTRKHAHIKEFWLSDPVNDRRKNKRGARW